MKRFLIALLLLAMLLIATACNRQIIDLTYHFNRAIISLPNGEIIEGKVESWRDYEDGDQLQVKIDGTTYLVHSSQVVLIAD